MKKREEKSEAKLSQEELKEESLTREKKSHNVALPKY